MTLISTLDPKLLDDGLRERLLFSGIADTGASGDCILVFGSKLSLKYRVPHAVELYKQGRASRILMSGGVVWQGQDAPEAESMKRAAMEMGVPSEHIWTETLSLHTKENVLASLLVLDRMLTLHTMRQVILVTTTYHMRRCLLTSRMYMPPWVRCIPSPVDDGSTRPNSWKNDPRGRLRIEQEARKLVEYVRKGMIADDCY